MATAWRLGVLRESSKATRLNFYPVWVACSHSLISGTHLTRRHIGRLRPLLCALHIPLSRVCSALVLCRWLAGVYQRITTPLFLMVINCQFIVFLSSLIVTGPLYHNWLRKSSVYTDYLFFFFCFSLVIFGSTPYYITLFSNVKRGPRGGACGVGCLDLTIDLSHSNIFPHFESPTDI